MSLFNWLKRKPENVGNALLKLKFTEGGLEFFTTQLPEGLVVDWLLDPGLFKYWEPVALLGQLESEGFAVVTQNTVLISWSDFFSALQQPDYSTCAALLGLPDASTLRIELSTQGSISDSDFEINLNWSDSQARPLAESVQRVGAVLVWRNQHNLLSEAQWQLVEAVTEFAHRPTEHCNQIDQERYWANIRSLAKAGKVKLDPYLDKTVIINANQLDMSLRMSEFDDIQVIEIAPLIPDVDPEKWLSTFDGFLNVQDHYDLNTPEGERIRVLIESDAKAVLQEIKKMPKRRVAGLRAENFLRNPFALLGEAMANVVAPEIFEAAREQAGIHLYDFGTSVLREDDGHIRALRIDLNAREQYAPKAPSFEIQGRNLAKNFTETLQLALDESAVCFRWGRNTLEIRGETGDQAAQLRAWLCEAWTGEPLISYADVFDLSSYSPRVAGIGIHQPQYVPYLARKDNSSGWVPENLEPVVEFRPQGGEPVLVAVPPSIQDSIKEWLASLPTADDMFTPSGWPAPLSKIDADQLLKTFQVGIPEIKKRNEAQTLSSESDGNNSIQSRKTLTIRQNVDQVDYLEERAQLLAFDINSLPTITTWLKSEVQFKPHQSTGIAWLQHLWSRQDHGVRGALLADDMGLGKTLQLLSFIAWYLEYAKNPDPVLVIAPVSLLENWQSEVNKFFDDRLGSLVLPLYGKPLRAREVRRGALEDELQASKIKGFLRPDWLGNAKLVLTTYETLRDLEFSFAKVKWSIMVCDEAQKIKTPGALMTHSAKAQNARFKVACTGTPVENSLADLWCLFDFIQPGLLKALSEFCRIYRRPIEDNTDENNERLEELRKLVDPQVLRRMKSDVADLPDKLTDESCRKLALSNYQQRLYEQVTSGFKAQLHQNGSAILGVLHRLRSICADPRESGVDSVNAVHFSDHCQRSPKLAWLITQLEKIREVDQKVIVFTEFKDLQRMIQHRTREHFGFSPIIINGGTKVGSEAGTNSRQALIDAFQVKPGFGVLILSTTAVGFGVNIQAANHVIHFTRAWNPAKEDQATDRAYRIGQQNIVHVYYPTVISENFQTFEEKLDNILEIKRQLASDMLNGTGEIDISEWGNIV